MYSKGRGVCVAAVGYLCLFVMGWMISMKDAGWYSRAYDLRMLSPLVIILGVMGILAFVQSRALDTIIFFSGAAAFGSAVVYHWSFLAYNPNLITTRMTEPTSFLGWFAILWAIVFCYLWASSFRSGAGRMLFLLGTWVSLLVLAISAWTGAAGWLIAAGYIGLATSVIAGVVSAGEIIAYGRVGNANLPVEGPGPRAIAAD